MTTQQFIENSIKIHDNKYDYSLSQYIGSHNKLKIICHNHGVFEQEPTSHLQGCGCPHCGYNISNAGKKWLDSFNNDNIIREKMIKINNKFYKVDGYDEKTNTIYEYFGSFWHGNPNRKDIIGYNPRIKKPYEELYNDTLKRIEIFKKNNYNLIYIWGH